MPVKETPFHTYNGINEDIRAASNWIRSKLQCRIILKEFLPGTCSKSIYYQQNLLESCKTHPCSHAVCCSTFPLGVAQGHPESSNPSPSAFLHCLLPPQSGFCSKMLEELVAPGPWSPQELWNKGILHPGTQEPPFAPFLSIYNMDIVQGGRETVNAFFRKGEKRRKSCVSKWDIILIWQVRKSRLKKVKRPVQGHTARELQD